MGGKSQTKQPDNPIGLKTILTAGTSLAVGVFILLSTFYRSAEKYVNARDKLFDEISGNETVEPTISKPDYVVSGNNNSNRQPDNEPSPLLTFYNSTAPKKGTIFGRHTQKLRENSFPIDFSPKR